MVGQLLIVDSDPARRAALRARLGRPEGEVAELADPVLLLDCIARSRPDLLLLDWEGADAAAAGSGTCARFPACRCPP